jgi:hypothetical protein
MAAERGAMPDKCVAMSPSSLNSFFGNFFGLFFLEGGGGCLKELRGGAHNRMSYYNAVRIERNFYWNPKYTQ